MNCLYSKNAMAIADNTKMVQYFPGVGKSLFAVMSAKPADEISRVRPIIDHLKPIVTPSIRQIGAMIMGKVLVILVAPVRV